MLIWLSIGFILIGFCVLISTKKSMENKIAFIKSNVVDQNVTKVTNSVIWWIVGVFGWGLISIILITLTFQDLFG
ncbi:MULTISPECIES: hypothetical protein [Oceanobacillus]|uniref:Uncharacterized protein n=1 Tax=Oceanobacillus kimchii TaxID=746691 RepID=A0ABQ5TJJ2_9BACI|nr:MULTISPECIES: hypothetical protein [Oceanobacillus]MBT2601175.1 hypothetical protein [Oceanobacillus sp. ISL-74]MBT2652401.1 hypothetical protein [Oceanobacillus sp. ISL-73]MCT1579065.1 hypothetical protein [Oceanobacillus kimchii]MCT2137407.1 hypothetical protein [Oceanobacillus kimchii]OEH54007.1 hypothetical protein AQ616_09470 [Oceanobacillus sp. E9]